MLPPVDNKVLRNNPRFEKLYNTITTSILNSDGSTKTDPAAKQRDAVREELNAYRLKAARVHLLQAAIQTIVPSRSSPPTKQQEDEEPEQQQRSFKSRRTIRSRSQSQSQVQTQTQTPQTPSLPPDLVQLLLLLPPFLTHASTLPSASLSLLLTSPPFTELPTLFPKILELVSARLTAQVKTLARVLSPTTNPSYIHRVIPSLPTLASTLVSDLATTRAELSRARLAATASLTRHLQQHTSALVLILAALEAKHGPIARSSELRAAEACQEARAWAIAAEALLWETRYLAYPPEARAALANYRQHLQAAGRRLEDNSRVREAELADYGVDVEDRRASRDLSMLLLPGNGNGGGVAAKGGRPTRTGGARRANSVDENKERTMREMARVWREMETRLREIQGDLTRLR